MNEEDMREVARSLRLPPGWDARVQSVTVGSPAAASVYDRDGVFFSWAYDSATAKKIEGAAWKKWLKVESLGMMVAYWLGWFLHGWQYGDHDAGEVTRHGANIGPGLGYDQWMGYAPVWETEPSLCDCDGWWDALREYGGAPVEHVTLGEETPCPFCEKPLDYGRAPIEPRKYGAH